MECSLSKIREPGAALAEAFRALKPEGWLLISDMYARKSEVLPGDGIMGRLETASRIRKRLADAGFSVAEMEDQSDSLIQWVGQRILDGGCREFYLALGMDRKLLKAAGAGYFICAARPSGLWETLRLAAEKSPFYRRMAENFPGKMPLSPGDWESFRQFPFTLPEQVKEAPECFLCVPAKEIARVITLKTSGSSGPPKRLFFTEADLLRTADFFEKGMQYMVAPGDRVTVYMEGPGRFSIGGLLKEGLSRIGVAVTVHGLIRDMKAAAADGQGKDCLVGTPGQMYALAVEAPWLRPKTVLLSADYVPRSVKRFVESTWGCRVFTHWGMTETGYGGGVQCGAREGYHLRDDDLLLEIVDPATGRPKPEGETGEIILTTTRRRGMPLIRYRTGDLGRFLAGPCPCGCLKPRLAEVDGRLDDAVRLEDGRYLSIHALDELLLSSGVIEDFEASYDGDRRELAVTVMAAKAWEKTDETVTVMAAKAEEKTAEAVTAMAVKSGGETDGTAAEKADDAAVLAAGEILRRQFGGSLKITVKAGAVSPYIGSGKRRILGLRQ